jgi:hypothetical protein
MTDKQPVHDNGMTDWTDRELVVWALLKAPCDKSATRERVARLAAALDNGHLSLDGVVPE